jgi:aminopeptidase N
LKQLLFLLGETNFSNSLASYFKKFAWKNTTLNDFIGSIEPFWDEKAHGFSLNDWHSEWICTAGLNVCSCKEKFDGSAGKLSIVQSFTQ